MFELERFGNEVFPRPTDVRKRLADNLTEARMLRRLLRVVEDAAVERHQRNPAPEPPSEPRSAGGGR